MTLEPPTIALAVTDAKVAAMSGSGELASKDETTELEKAPPSQDELPSEPRRARFLKNLPDHPDLQKLGEAFEQGNYAFVRREAPLLIERVDDAAVQEAARDLLRRIEPDPLTKYLLALSILLLLVVTAFVYATQQ